MLNIALLAFHMAVGQNATPSPVAQASTHIGKTYMCPRCRRAERRGPKKRPSPKKGS